MTQHLTDYLTVATEWHRRGFFTTPVKPGAKHPRLPEWTTKPAKNLSVAMQNAYDYPHDDVGLVSRRGDGHPFWIDIDHPSVEGAILRDTGHRLPRTLTTSSRPLTAQWKKHFCYRGTKYSVSKWRTEMTGIRDFTMPNEEGRELPPNLFDVKGCGGGGFVVAAGCCRQTVTPDGVIDEQYTLTDDSPAIDVPDWLVDWVFARYRRFRAEEAVYKATKAEEARLVKSALVTAETERRVTAFEYDQTKGVLSIDAKGGALVPKEYRNGFLKSLGGELATRGIPRTQTEQMLQIATGLCEPYSGGDVERDKAVQNVVNRLRVGNLWIGRAQIRDAEKSEFTGQFTGQENPSSLVSSLVPKASSLDTPLPRLTVLRRAARELPWEFGPLSSHFINERLHAAATAARVDCGKPEDWRKAVSTTLKGIGAKSSRSRQPTGRVIWVWSRPTTKDLPRGSSTSNAVKFTGETKDLAEEAPCAN